MHVVASVSLLAATKQWSQNHLESSVGSVENQHWDKQVTQFAGRRQTATTISIRTPVKPGIAIVIFFDDPHK